MNKQKIISLLLAGSVISSCVINSTIIANADTSHNSKETNKTIESSYNKGVTLKTVSLKDNNGNVLGNINPYDMLDIVSTSNGKYLVITQSGIKGYLNSSDFEIVNSGENFKLENLDKVSNVSNVTTVLNLREQPTTNSTIIDTLPNNTILHIKGKQGDWYKVEVNNKVGFVYGLFTNAREVNNQKIGNTTIDQAKKNILNIQKQENKKQAYKETLKGIMNEDKVQNKTKQSTSKSINVNQDSTKHQAPSHKTEKTSQEHHDVVKPTGDKGHDITTTPSKPDTTPSRPAEKPVKPVEPTKPAEINNAPVLKANNLILVQGEKFTDAMIKATAQDKEDGNLTGSIVYTGHVNTEVPGNYIIHLSIKDSQGAMAKTSVTVTVKPKAVKPIEPITPDKPSKPDEKPVTPDTKPMEPLQPSKPVEKPVKPSELNNAPTIQGHDLIMTEGQKFSVDMLGLNAQDKEDGNLTANIKVLENTVNTAKAGKYQVVVKVTDKQGASCKRTFVVTVKAKPVAPSVINACPQITGHGVEIEQGTKFSVDMLGLKATDKEDGNLTDSIKVLENTVNTNEPGNYIVKVKVTDKQGASMTKTFTVTVNKKVVKKTYDCKLEQSTENGSSIKGTVKYKITYTDGSSDIISCTGNGIDLPSKEIKNIEVYSAPRGYVAVNSEINTINQNNNTTTIGKFIFKEVYSNYDISIVQKYSDGSNVSGVKYEIFYNDGTSNIITDNQYSLKLEDKLVKDIKVIQLPEECSSYSMSKSESNIGDNVVKAEYQFIFKKKEHINIAPTITGKSITLIQGEKFNNSMLDVKANDQEDGNLTSKVKFEGTVDTAKVGTYEVTATVVDKNGAKATKTFTVKVVEEEAPVLNGKNITIAEGDKFDISMLGLTASDKEDGNLTKDIKIVSNNVNADKAGTYDVVAKVTDSFGKTTTQTFKVTVKAKPVEGWTASSQAFHNAVAQKMYSLVNAYRQSKGIAPYEINQECVNAANWKSQDMTKNNYFDHKDLNGKQTWEHAGFENVQQENIAQRSFGKTTNLTKADADRLAEDLFNQWKASAGHNAAMLNDWNTGMGFGFVLTDSGLVNATQDFC